MSVFCTIQAAAALLDPVLASRMPNELKMNLFLEHALYLVLFASSAGGV
jgi:hypothetical protein